MDFSLLRQRFLLGLMACTSAMLSANAFAQETNADERLVLPIGSIFEIVAYDSTDSSEFQWVLTRDREFVKAGRESIFRMRFSSPGRYRLIAESRSITGQAEQRQILLDIQNTNEPLGDTNNVNLVDTFPEASANGTVPITNTKHILALNPVQLGQVLTLDLDTSKDSDSDGSPANDNDAKGTFFSSNSTPLHIWFIGGMIERTMSVSDGSTSQTLQLGGSALPTGTTVSDGNVISEAMQDGTFLFRIDSANTTDPLLFEWTFGDGTMSLLDTPIHTFTSNGDFDVSVRVRNLRTGSVMGTHSTRIRVDNAPIVNGQTSSEDSDSNEGGSAFRSVMSFLLKAIVVLVVSILIGAVITFLIRLMRRGNTSLPETMEKAEEKFVGKSNGATEVAPLELKEDKSPPPPPSKKKVQTAEVAKKDTPPVPKKQEPKPPKKEESGKAPDWLKGGLQETGKKEPNTASPPPPPPPPKPATPPPPPPPPQPKPKPAPEPPKEQPKPTPNPNPAPTPADPPLPDWLKPSANQNTPPPTPKPKPTPQPPKEQPKPMNGTNQQAKQKPPQKQLPAEEKKEALPPAKEEPIAFIRAESIEEQKPKEIPMEEEKPEEKKPPPQGEGHEDKSQE